MDTTTERGLTLTTEERRNIADQIAAVRLTGQCNMFDSPCVQRIANEIGYYDLVNCIGDSRRLNQQSEYADILFKDSGAIQREDLYSDTLELLQNWEQLHGSDDDDEYEGEDDFPMALEYSGAYGLDPTGES